MNSPIDCSKYKTLPKFISQSVGNEYYSITGNDTFQVHNLFVVT